MQSLKYELAVLFIILSFYSTTAQTSRKSVTAQKGDGIYSMLKRNNLDPSRYLNPFIELNEDKLGKNNTLILGRNYSLPTPKDVNVNNNGSSKTKNTSVDYPIFGSKYSNVEIIDNKLKGTVYYLVAGHGGPDPGALGKYGNYTLSEDEYAYDVTIRLARILIQHSATVYMIIRDKNDGIRDESILSIDRDEVTYPNLTIPINPLKRLQQRTNAINNLYKKHRGRFQQLIVIHLDSNIKSEDIDVFFYHHEKSKSGKKLANSIQATFREKYAQHQPNRGYRGTVRTRSSLYMLRNTNPTTVYIELGNINNPRDQQRFVQTNNRQAVAQWISEGMIRDFNTR